MSNTATTIYALIEFASTRGKRVSLIKPAWRFRQASNYMALDGGGAQMKTARADLPASSRAIPSNSAVLSGSNSREKWSVWTHGRGSRH